MDEQSETPGRVSLISRAPAELTREHRRLALLTRTGLFGADTLGAEITRACAFEDLRAAYRLVYDIFLQNGYITPGPCRMRVRVFEALVDTATFVAKREGNVIAAISLVQDGPELGLPSDVAFRRELDALRAQGLRLGEITSQATQPPFRKTAVTTQLMRCCPAQGLLTGRDIIIISVSPSHASFYELMGFCQRADVRSYSPDHYDPVVLMTYPMVLLREPELSIDACQKFMTDFLSFKNPFVPLVKVWHEEAQRVFHDAAELRRIFVEESGLLESCTDAQRAAVQRAWGAGTYVSVLGPARGRHQPRATGLAAADAADLRETGGA